MVIKIWKFLLLVLVTFIFSNVFPIEYKVKNGDNLWNISRKYNISVEYIIFINSLETSKILPGTILLIPDKVIDYKVEKKDTLTKIANDNNTSINNILLLNHLRNKTIFPEQNLKIPVFLSNKMIDRANIEYYTVKKGDSLYSISKKFGVSIENIKAWNKKNSDALLYGETIRICNPIFSRNKDKTNKEKFSENLMPLPVEKSYIYNVQKKQRGVLIFLNTKAPVKSIDDGIVEFIGHISGYRNVLIVRYGKFHYIYGSLNQILVREDEKVKSEQIVGYASSVLKDSSENSFFYLEIRNEKHIVDPYKIYPYFKDNYMVKK